MLGIVLINYKNAKETTSYIYSEIQKISTPYRIVIVDNSCDKKSYTELETILKKKNDSVNENIILIEASYNLGYAKANNLGAKILINKFPDIKYLLFSNTDIEIRTKDAIEQLIKKIESSPDIGVIGPRIQDQKGNDQNPNRSQSFTFRWILTPLLFPFFYLLRDYFGETVINAKEGDYYRLTGCFFLFKKESFLKINMFDEHTFLFAEELIIAERLRNEGLKCYYLPKVNVLHHHSVTINKKLSNSNKLRLRYNSELYYFKTYIGISTIQRIVSQISLFIFINIYQEINTLIQKIK